MEVWKNSVCPVSSLVLCMSRFVKARSSRCIIGKAFSMCQKNRGVEKVMFSGPYGILRQWSVSCRWSLHVFALLPGSCLIWGASCPSWRMALSTMCPFGPNLPQHDCTLEGLCQEIPSCIFSKHKIHRFLKCRQVLSRQVSRVLSANVSALLFWAWHKVRKASVICYTLAGYWHQMLEYARITYQGG